jgi:hypothetical protein
MVAKVLLRAERHVANRLPHGLTGSRRISLDALLEPHSGHTVSSLAWVRQLPGAPRHRSRARLADQLRHLRRIGINPAALTAEHLKAISPVWPVCAR